MKNTELVKTGLYLLFNEFLNNGLPDDEFIKRLKNLCKGSGRKGYWWRFFKSDPAANCPLSIQSSLSSAQNRGYIKECIDIALKERGLIVYYS